MPTLPESLMTCLRRITPWAGPLDDGQTYVADLVAAAANNPATYLHRGAAATTDALNRAAALLRVNADAVPIAAAVEQLELAIELADAARNLAIAARTCGHGVSARDAAVWTDLIVAITTTRHHDETAGQAAWEEGLGAARGRGEDWAHERYFD